MELLPDEIASPYLSFKTDSSGWTWEGKFSYKEIDKDSKEWNNMKSLFDNLGGSRIPINKAYIVYVVLP